MEKFNSSKSAEQVVDISNLAWADFDNITQEQKESLEKDGWRLPSIQELYSAYLKKDTIENWKKNDFYWSSSEFTDNDKDMWAIYFNTGYVSYYDKSHDFNIRYVKEIKK